MKKKMPKPMAPVRSGAAAHEIKMFFVSLQFTDPKPLAAMVNPMMHPMTCEWAIPDGTGVRETAHVHYICKALT